MKTIFAFSLAATAVLAVTPALSHNTFTTMYAPAGYMQDL